MKTYSDDLFRLIKFLEPDEKAYFKRYASGNELSSQPKSYMILYDAIDNLSEYDESILRKSISDRVNLKHLSKLKNYLMDALIECLEKYQSNASPILILHKYMSRAEFLISKGLYKRAFNFAKKAESIAHAYELYHYLQFINHKEQEIKEHMHPESKEWIKQLEGLRQQYAWSYHKVNNLLKYSHMAAKTILLFRVIYVAQTKKDREKVTKLKKTFSSYGISKAETILSKTSYFYLSSIFILMMRKKNYAYQYSQNIKKAILIYQALSINKLQFFSQHYIVAINNYINIVGVGAPPLDEVKRLYKKSLIFYNNLPGKIKNKKTWDRLMYTKLNYLKHLNYNHHFIQALHFTETELAFYKNKKNYSIYAYQLIALEYHHFCTSFILSKFREANKCLNRVFKMKEHSGSDLYYRFFYLMNIFTHYELGNLDTLPYIIKASVRGIQKHKKLNLFENIMVKFFRKEISGVKKGSRQEQDVFLKLYQSIKQLPPTPESLEGFDYMRWVQSKMEGRSFIKVLKEKKMKSEQ